MKLPVHNLCAISVAAALQLVMVGAADAQTQDPVYHVSPPGLLPLSRVPQLGPEITDALQTYINPNPVTPLLSHTWRIHAANLWDQHVWLNADGTGTAFEATKTQDGQPHIAVMNFSWRLRNNQTGALFCRWGAASPKTEDCIPLEKGHQLYDEWFVNYDSTSNPALKNIHQEYSILGQRE